MEDEIFDIVTDLLRKDIAKNEAIDKLLFLNKKNDLNDMKKEVRLVRFYFHQTKTPSCWREYDSMFVGNNGNKHIFFKGEEVAILSKYDALETKEKK